MPADATLVPPCHAPDYPERDATHAEIARLVFGYEVKQDAPVRDGARPGWWYHHAPFTEGVARWHVVPAYLEHPYDAVALRRRLREPGYDVGVFGEALPQLAAPLGGRVVCIARSDGVPVARGEGSGGRAGEVAKGEAALALVRQPGWRVPASRAPPGP